MGRLKKLSKINNDLATTLIGMVGAGSITALELVKTGQLEPKTIALAAGFAALGYLSNKKD